MSEDIELDDVSLEAISAAAIPAGRTMEQQITHWIALARAVESNPDFHFSAVRSALTGTLDLAVLSDLERAVLNEYVLAALTKIDPIMGSFLDFRLKKSEDARPTASDSKQRP